MRCGPRDQNWPDRIILYDATRQIQQFQETRAIQEGVPGIFGQAHLPCIPTDEDEDQDCLQSFASFSIEVQQESQPEVNRSTVQGHHTLGGSFPNGAQALPLSTEAVPQVTATPALMDIANLTVPEYRNTDDEGMRFQRGPYAQSVSGFSDIGMNEPSAGRLRLLSCDAYINFSPNSQDLDERQRTDRAEGMQPRPGFVKEERTMKLQEKWQRTDRAEGMQPRQEFSDEERTMRPQDVIIRHPHYMDLEARMRSYNEWPLSSQQHPESLAQAGLFYTGQRDQCCCFQCGVGLRKWEPNDDPMEEHELWSPGCPFLEEAKRNKCMTVVKAPERVGGNPAQRMQNPSTKGIKKFQVLEEMGFAREVVETAVNKMGKEADVENVLEMLLKPKMANEVELPPEMDPKVCKVCEENLVCVSQFKCGHIVCANCVPRRGGDGMFRCGICGSEVTRTTAYDNSALHH